MGRRATVVVVAVALVSLSILRPTPAQADVRGDPLVPTSVGITGYARGIDASGVDPAALAYEDPGFALQLRQQWLSGDGSPGRFALYGLASFWQCAFGGGYAWQWQGNQLEQGSVALGCHLWGRRLSLGSAYRVLRMRGGGSGPAGRWDLGIFSEASSWLSLSAGWDGLNRPLLRGSRVPRTFRVSAFFRPWFGEPRLTVGTQFRVRGEIDDADLYNTNVLIDWEAARGLHVLGSAAHGDPGTQLWVGVGFELGGLELRTHGGAGVDGAPDVGGATLTMRPSIKDSLLAPERTIEMPLEGQLQSPGDSLLALHKAIPLAPLQLRLLGRDDSVRRVVLSIGPIESGMATVDELRAEIRVLRRRGKEVIAHLVGGAEKAFLIALAADKIVLDPTSNLQLNGFAVTNHFLAGALDKIGVRFETVAVGRYKTAPDPLVRRKPRPEQAEVQNTIVKQAHEHLLQALVDDRGKTREEAEAIVAQGVFTAAEALGHGLVDALSQPTDLAQLPVARRQGELIQGLPLHESERWGQRATIAVIPIVGTITMQVTDNPFPGSTTIAGRVVKWLESALSDPNVKGAVLRVDSPGGDVYASELIWRAVRRLAAVKPVVVSMGDLAASGGYYAAVGADTIFAHPNTLTGSIGIYAIKLDLSRLYKLLDIHAETYQSGPQADWDNFDRPMSKEAKAALQRVLQSAYDGFLARVGYGRRLSADQVAKAADGKVFTGVQALELGLIDRFGGIADAVQAVMARAGLKLNEVRISVPDDRLSLTALMELVQQSQADVSVTKEMQQQFHELAAVRTKTWALMPQVWEAGP